MLDREVPPARAALIGLAALASAMGIGRFAFTPLLPLMQQAGALSLAQGGSLARANYLGYLIGALVSMATSRSPGRAARIGLAAVAALTAAMGLTGDFAAWIVLRFLAGVASAFVLVGVSAWVLPLLAARGRGSWSGWVFSGVGIGIFLCGLIAVATGTLGVSPGRTWLILGACSAGVSVACWGTLGAGSEAAASRGGAPAETLPAGAWPLVAAYGAFGLGYIVPATFLPAAARLVVPDPAVFAWTWPVFGLAAAASTTATTLWSRGGSPRTLWVLAQLVMAAGVLAPAWKLSVWSLLCCAILVGGTFMVVTMAGIQQARRLAGASAQRLVAAMTAAFALGQLVGPSLVTSLGSASSPGLALPHAIAAAVLLLGVAALSFRAAPGAVTRSLGPGEGT